MLFSTATTFTFGPMKIHTLVKKHFEFLNNVFEWQLDMELPVGERVRMWYLHDGAPPHFARLVAGLLNNHFPNQWVNRNGPVA